jgi:MFS superfamily sulfate permease-like transporter
MAHLLGACFHSLPCSASLSRAAIIDQLDARTLLHSAVSFVTMTTFLLYFAPLLRFLPKSVLSATIFAVVYKFLKPRQVVRLWKLSHLECLMWVVTFFMTLFAGVLQGIIAGVACSFFALVTQTSDPLVMTLGKLPGTEMYRDLARYPQARELPGIVILRFGSSLNFANMAVFKKTVHRAINKRSLKSDSYSDADIEKFLESETSDLGGAADVSGGGGVDGSPIQFFVLEASGVHGLDSSATTVMEDMITEFMGRTPPIEILLAPASDPLIEAVQRSPLLYATLGRSCYLSVHAAVGYATSEIARGLHAMPSFADRRSVEYKKAISDGRGFT